MTRVSGHGFADFRFSGAVGTPGGAVVVGGKVFLRGTRSYRTVAAILRAAKVHDTFAPGAAGGTIGSRRVAPGGKT